MTKQTADSGFYGGSDSKESSCNAGDLGSISGSGRSSGEANGDPCSGILAWQALVHVVSKEFIMTEQLTFRFRFSG